MCPLLKVFSGGDAAAPRNRFLEVATSGLASVSRLPFGVTVQPECAARPAERSPAKPIIVYERGVSFAAGARRRRSST